MTYDPAIYKNEKGYIQAVLAKHINEQGVAVKRAAHIAGVSTMTMRGYINNGTAIPACILAKLTQSRDFPFEFATEIAEAFGIDGHRMDQAEPCFKVGMTLKAKALTATAEALEDDRITHDELPGLLNSWRRSNAYGRRLIGWFAKKRLSEVRA